MKTKIFVNHKYSFLTEFLEQIPEHYDSMGDIIHQGRNEIRLISERNFSMAIKYYKKISFANKLIYATIRKSKARRAYEHSCLLINYGISSPEPIAYINCYKYGILYKSFYISLFCNYPTIKELFNLPINKSEEALKAFARFTYQMHSKGILHKDYNVDNVLYSLSENKFDFSLIDNNRMRFYKYSYWKGVRNLERLNIPVDKMGIIATEYAREVNASDIETLHAMSFFRLGFLLRLVIKKKLKALTSLHGFFPTMQDKRKGYLLGMKTIS